MRIITKFDFEMYDDVKRFDSLKDVMAAHRSIRYRVQSDWAAMQVGENQWVMLNVTTCRWNAALLVREYEGIMYAKSIGTSWPVTYSW